MPSVFRRSALSILLLSCLNGCDRQGSQNGDANDVVAGDDNNIQLESSSTANTEASIAVEPTAELDAGSEPIAQNAPLTELADNQDLQTTVITPGEKSESAQDQAESELKQSDNQQADKPDQGADDLIADLGFSGTEDTEQIIEQETQTPNYCLKSSAKIDPNWTSKGIVDACTGISNRLASVSMQSCMSAALEPSGCESVQGFPILVREFGAKGDKQPQGRILLIGGTHGDELTSVSVTFKWIEKLNKYHSGLFHWHIAPMMNPDGVLKSGATRTNFNGVDLNRNLPSEDWELNALKYWQNRGRKDPRKYPGKQAASEPETQWLIDEINTFKPHAIISVHAPYGVVDYDALLLNTAPKSLGKLRLNLLGTYPGSLGNYAGINLDIPVITLELPHSWVMPSDKETAKIWEDIVSWLQKNVDDSAKIEETADIR